MHGDKFYTVKKHWDNGFWTKDQVRNAVTNPVKNPWITPKEYEEITGEKYD